MPSKYTYFYFNNRNCFNLILTAIVNCNSFITNLNKQMLLDLQLVTKETRRRIKYLTHFYHWSKKKKIIAAT